MHGLLLSLDNHPVEVAASESPGGDQHPLEGLLKTQITAPPPPSCWVWVWIGTDNFISDKFLDDADDGHTFWITVLREM